MLSIWEFFSSSSKDKDSITNTRGFLFCFRVEVFNNRRHIHIIDDYSRFHYHVQHSLLGTPYIMEQSSYFPFGNEIVLYSRILLHLKNHKTVFNIYTFIISQLAHFHNLYASYFDNITILKEIRIYAV